MLARVVGDMRVWLDMGLPLPRVSLNVSSSDFYRGKLDEQLTAAFARENVSLEHLMLEVTEDVCIGQRDDVAARQIKAMRAKGLSVALDDFGTGFASLTHLLTFPVDMIKIDKSFINRLAPGNPSSAIVRGLLDIAREMNISVVAEGVETEVQAAQLRALGCSLGQGFLFSRAVDRDAFTQMLRQDLLSLRRAM
jgi:EAL domain-containing protein (putative c-di-GMP-specific phosphodiesterase class I)